jgi:hypothetical protein
MALYVTLSQHVLSSPSQAHFELNLLNSRNRQRHQSLRHRQPVSHKRGAQRTVLVAHSGGRGRLAADTTRMSLTPSLEQAARALRVLAAPRPGTITLVLERRRRVLALAHVSLDEHTQADTKSLSKLRGRSR